MIEPPERDDFLYPHSSYHSDVKPENLIFNANLQEFSQKVIYICNLETTDKLTPQEAYHQIKGLFKQLKHSKTQLGIPED